MRENSDITSKVVGSVLHGGLDVVVLFLIATRFIVIIQCWVSLLCLQLSSQFTKQLLHMLQHRRVITSQLTVQLVKIKKKKQKGPKQMIRVFKRLESSTYEKQICTVQALVSEKLSTKALLSCP